MGKMAKRDKTGKDGIRWVGRQVNQLRRGEEADKTFFEFFEFTFMPMAMIKCLEMSGFSKQKRHLES